MRRFQPASSLPNRFGKALVLCVVVAAAETSWAQEAVDAGAGPAADAAAGDQAPTPAVDAGSQADADDAGPGDDAGVEDPAATQDDSVLFMTDDLKPAATDGPNLVTDGTQPVTVKDGDFRIVPPKGWEVYTEMPGLTLYLQAPDSEGQKYRRSIQVASFNGSKFIDEETALEYGNVIVTKFGSASSSIDDYRIRNFQSIEMTDGRDGIVYYTQFFFDGVPLMQMHVLVSSRVRHYLITYTDVAAHFASDTDPNLAEVWEVVTSTKLGDRTPVRQETLYIFLGAAGLMLLLGSAGYGVFLWMSTRRVSESPEVNHNSELATTDEESIPHSIVPVELSPIDDDDDDPAAWEQAPKTTA